MLSAAIDPVIHAALVTIAIWLVHWLFSLIGIQVGNEVAQGLAEVLVGYILSLFGWAVYAYVKVKAFKNSLNFNGQPSYKPPFT